MVALGATKSTVRTAADEVAEFPAPSKTRITKLTVPEGIKACSAWAVLVPNVIEIGETIVEVEATTTPLANSSARPPNV